MPQDKGKFRLAVVAGLALLISTAPIEAAVAQDEVDSAEERFVSPNMLGGIGLLQTRTARFGPDGLFHFGYSHAEPLKRIYMSVHIFPWMEATFRYTEFTDQLYSPFPWFSGYQTLKDRGADLKFRLLREGTYRPAVAVGLQDGLGTGIFASEYVVASKRFGDFDFSLGMAWGYLGSKGTIKNPLIRISDRFKSRAGEASTALGGTPTFLSFFGGETVGLFGGLEYRTPIDGLTFKYEYDGRSYNALSSSPYNLGFNFRPFPWIDISVGRERGNLNMVRVSLRAELHDEGVPKFDPPPPPVEARPALVELIGAAEATAPATTRPPPGSPPTVLRAAGSEQAAAAGLFGALELHGMQLESFQLAGREATIGVGPLGQTADVRAGAAAALEALPETVDGVTLVPWFPTPTGTVRATRVAAGSGPHAAAGLFGALELHGMQLESFQLAGREATIGVGLLGQTADVRAGAAAALEALPETVDGVTLVPRFPTPTSTVRVTRAAAGSESPAEALFAGLDRLGLDVEGIEIFGTRAMVQVAARDPSRGIPFGAAARLTAAALSVPEVSIQDTRTGGAETWLAFGDVTRRLTAPANVTPFRLPPVDPPYSEDQRLAIAKRMGDALEPQGLYLETLQLEQRSATVALTGLRFMSEARNLGFATRIIINHLPAPIEEVTVVLLSGGMEASRTTFLRSDIEREFARRGSLDEVFARADIEPGLPGWPDFRYRVPGRYPQLGFSVGPQTRQHIGGPDQFYLYQFWLAGNLGIDVARGLTVTGMIGRNLYHNFDKIRLLSDSILPHVRSDIKHYLQQGAERNIVRLQSDFFLKLSESTYGHISGGLYEEMFGGISAEILYRPFDSRLALGVDMSRVRQRTFEQQFEFQVYEVDTGFVSIHYEEPFYNALLSLHLGRYLAGDKGGTLEVSRRFDSGIRIGAWATLTDVPFAVFGEGSFDKGFFIVIPFEVFLTQSSTSTGVFAFRPLFRDGGQRLVQINRLYDITQPATLDAVTRDWPRLFQ